MSVQHTQINYDFGGGYFSLSQEKKVKEIKSRAGAIISRNSWLDIHWYHAFITTFSSKFLAGGGG